ncbi:HAMP domain-containing histidine kinase, partial [bacterium]|nr:HAMP domain-containing histidine kinase [bacterium]
DSPITRILGRIDLIRKYWEHEDVTKEKRTLWIRDVQNECDHIDFLVRRYSLKGPQYKEINLLKEVVIPIRYLLAPVAQKTKYIAIIHDIEEEIPNVIVDVHRFKQVIYNLIINAIKYSRRNTDITIVLRNFKGSIIIEISNFGIGIQKGWQEKIFKEYVRAPGAKKFHPSGTGRGLHTCKTIVADEHGGKIWLGKHANPTVFKVSIPSHRVCLSRR